MNEDAPKAGTEPVIKIEVVEVVEEDAGEIAFVPTALPNFFDRADELDKSLNCVASPLRAHLGQLTSKGRMAGIWVQSQAAVCFGSRIGLTALAPAHSLNSGYT